MTTEPDLLQRSQQLLGTPFDLVLDNGEHLQVLEIVRRVPGRRIVCRGIWKSQLVYVKIFLGKQAERYATRDRRGVRLLRDAAIATPELLCETGIEAQKKCRILVFAAIAAENAEQAWLQLEVGARLQLARRLVEAVAHHHQAGLVQTDLYLKNFLVTEQQIYSLDGDGIRPQTFWRWWHQPLDNLARLVSKFDVGSVGAWLPELLQVYADARGLNAVPAIKDMQQRIARHWQADMRQYAAKVQRSCTDVRTLKTPSAYLAINRAYDHPGLLAALEAPDALLGKAGVARLKSGNTCTVASVQIDQRNLVIKRYNIKNFWHWFGRMWRPSRAVQAWANAYRLQLKHIATPVAVAVLERRCWGLRREAYLLTEYVEAHDAKMFFADQTVDVEVKQRVAMLIVQLFYQLYCLQLEHGDFKASNLLIQGEQPILIDLDSMRQYGDVKRFQRRHVRDLRRFMRNWQNNETVRYIFNKAFLTVYTDGKLLHQAGIK
ncbi:Lipopolysaccharide kinase (Kdo/WaaP) family protein [Methylobacillus rhizosphaerae]|uniref:Lipopolysaccharide kinase (Kdo/WaaP) family protein n=1 Tax=Methylobacillus rhizosphaerae TaxID=551994 RepID=A0A239AI26_9PROT|nr:lipopolysaccharide kinase InaA family protein [Methylobacillus rhizosphaerae]SNR94668.1 Lipopolysaccharide kinase (Kdo/WaaP) family protein [Methylobacillus rhizosphaerae]